MVDPGGGIDLLQFFSDSFAATNYRSQKFTVQVQVVEKLCIREVFQFLSLFSLYNILHKRTHDDMNKVSILLNFSKEKLKVQRVDLLC